MKRIEHFFDSLEDMEAFPIPADFEILEEYAGEGFVERTFCLEPLSGGPEEYIILSWSHDMYA
jgi:hypothetical protein